MAMRAVRGATTAENTREDILNASAEMVREIISRNGIDTSDITDITFTVTNDLTKVFPAAAVRRVLGITDVPLLDMAAPFIEGALERCIRVIVRFNTDKKNSEIHHVYLNGATVLRPDIAAKEAYISVAVDGPAGAGKSSVSKAVAKALGYVYIDTGAMYRSVALYAIQNGMNCKTDADILIERLDDIKIEIKHFGGTQHIYLNGEDVSEAIRREDVSVGASDVAVIPEVRKKLVAIQQDIAKTDNVIMDGRDICSYVLPNAQVKIFLTASVQKRAERRYKELTEKGVECDFEKIKSDIEYRDKNDSERQTAPLKRADDAVLIDTSDMSFDESVDAIKALIKNTKEKR